MSFSKFLADVTVPTGGWDFAWTDTGGAHVATVGAGSYSFIGFMAMLDEKIEALADDNLTLHLSSEGAVTLDDDSAWTVTWATTDDALSTLLGFDESESVDGSHVLTASSDHRSGWYPGLVTYGSGDGEGFLSDTRWQPVDMIGRSLAGSGEQSSVKPGRIPYERTIVIDMIGTTEGDDPYRGPKAFLDQYATKIWSWYEDRDTGTAAAEGTQGDPDVDTTADYWRVDCKSCDIAISQKHFSYYTVTLTFNGRPD
jgi:hypothetical protein